MYHVIVLDEPHDQRRYILTDLATNERWSLVVDGFETPRVSVIKADGFKWHSLTRLHRWPSPIHPKDPYDYAESFPPERNARVRIYAS